MSTLRVLFIGDVVGDTGQMMLQRHLGRIRAEHHIDAVVVNGENSASDGRGITSRVMKFFKENNVDVVTTGNHVWQKADIYSYFTDHKDLLRPANFPTDTPGGGVTTFTCKGHEIGIINMQGRVFMRELLSCPFRATESLLTYLKNKTPIIFVDFHAETTAEKMAVAHFLDGKVSGFVGTHTHVQTADERILPGGTAFITDLGMVGSLNGMLGMKKEPIIRNFLTQMPAKFEVDTESPYVLSGVFIDVDTRTGKAKRIERIRIVDNEAVSQ